MGASTRIRNLTGLLQQGEVLRGYGLLAPAVLLSGATLVVPLIMLVVYSFWSQTGFDLQASWALDNYAIFFSNPTYLLLLGKSLAISAASTALVVVLSYPVACYLAFGIKKHKAIWLFAITLPFWTSYLLRVFSWKVILGYNGVINSGLMSLGIIGQPLDILLYNPVAVVLTLTHAWAPFALLPIFISLEKIDRSLIEAAQDLGDGVWATFRRVILPLSMPGVISASLLVFVPTVGEYVTPQLVGGTSGVMIGNVIQSMFGRSNNWPMGAAISIVTMIAILAVTCLFLWSVKWRKSPSGDRT